MVATLKHWEPRQFEKPTLCAWVSALTRDTRSMLLAYIDEIGEPGAFVSKADRRFNTSPAFGYAGFVVPAENARSFGAEFTHVKRTLFRAEIDAADDAGKWERKGADIFRPDTPTKYGYQIRAFNGLVKKLRVHGGRVFYYADEKRVGTAAQVGIDPADRESAAMKETLNRVCRFAETEHKNLLVMIDQITEKTRAERLPNMYGHILSRAAGRQEMKRIVEPPMHVDSVLSSNIQFADWIAAAVSRAIDYQLLRDSPYGWIANKLGETMNHGTITYESKLHFTPRAISDLNNFDVFKSHRPAHPAHLGNSLLASNAALMAKIYAKSHTKK